MRSGDKAEDSSSIEEMMQEVRRRAGERRREGLYAGLDDALPFAEEALRDDLAAAANRVAAAARIPSIVPELPVPAPHDGGDELPGRRSQDASEKSETIEPVASASQTPSASDLIFKAVSSVGKKAFRVVVGDRVERFIEGSVEFFQATAGFSREVAERILLLERRIEELERMHEQTIPSENQASGRRKSTPRSSTAKSTAEAEQSKTKGPARPRKQESSRKRQSR